MSYLDAIKLNHEIVLSTSSKKGEPRSTFVISKGFVDGKLLFGLCFSGKTLDNLKNNPQVSIAVKQNNEYYRINGTAQIIESGKIVEDLLKLCKPPMPKVAILIQITEVVNLEDGSKII